MTNITEQNAYSFIIIVIRRQILVNDSGREQFVQNYFHVRVMYRRILDGVISLMSRDVKCRRG